MIGGATLLPEIVGQTDRVGDWSEIADFLSIFASAAKKFS